MHMLWWALLGWAVGLAIALVVIGVIAVVMVAVYEAMEDIC